MMEQGVSLNCKTRLSGRQSADRGSNVADY
jgi:hypothetical protein